MMFVWTLMGGLRGIGVAAAVLLAAGTYDRLIDDPWVVSQARQGFVVTAERDALAARLDEEHRQRLAAETAADWLRIELAGQEAQAAIEAEKTEQEIADYEKKLADAGRSCFLDDTDLEFLSNH
jgi:uncharacterized lipoprotein YmbA